MLLLSQIQLKWFLTYFKPLLSYSFCWIEGSLIREIAPPLIKLFNLNWTAHDYKIEVDFWVMYIVGKWRTCPSCQYQLCQNDVRHSLASVDLMSATWLLWWNETRDCNAYWLIMSPTVFAHQSCCVTANSTTSYCLFSHSMLATYLGDSVLQFGVEF